MADFELQLGHLCNNRCLFCVSGALTHARAAPVLESETLLDRLRDARAAGHGRLTLLGGEPTIQPHFFEILSEAVRLGFAPIVIFSNGSRAGTTNLVERVAATGGEIEWCFSLQGATPEAHDSTTRRPGSFDQVLSAMDRARAFGQAVSVNTCVVEQNYRTLPDFAKLLVPRGVRRLHVDMLSPYETGARLGADKSQDVPEYVDLLRRRDEALPTLADVRPLQPRYSELVEPLERMVAAFPVGFDVNIGNLPFCVAPRLASRIHHGGQATETVTADDMGDIGLQYEKTKYEAKADLRHKPDSCARCAYDDRCRGAYRAYLDWFGAEEFEPVDAVQRANVHPRVAAAVSRLEATSPHGMFEWRGARFEASGTRAECDLVSAAGERAVVWIEQRGACRHVGYRLADMTVGRASPSLVEALRSAMAALGHPSAQKP